MKPQIDIAMTAVLRPSLLNETLGYIKERIYTKEVDFKLVINVDPIGESVDPMEVVKVAKSHFDNVVYNVPDKASFPKAVKWVWDHTTAPHVFHWEDDAFILRKIDILDMIRIHEKYSDVSSLRLFKHDTNDRKTIHTFGCLWRYNEDGFYIADDWQRQFGLNPILIKSAFVKEAVPLLIDELNPEKQFRVAYDWMIPLISKWKYGLYTKPGDKALVWGRKGKAWMKSQGLFKPKNAFVEWERGKPRKLTNEV